ILDMTFTNRIDNFTLSLITVVILICLSTIFFTWWSNTQIFGFNLWLTILLLSIIGIIIWTIKDTYYILTEKELKFKSGFLKGSIKTESIKELEVNKTMWVGIKPATAKRGVIVKYNQFDQIYISPRDNEEFVKELLKIKPEIKINRY